MDLRNRATSSPCFKKAHDRHYYQANTHSDKANADQPSYLISAMSNIALLPPPRNG
ncbi:hypothetical protein T10_5312 [Trichinella papuae]|uniref:Uncharacterized protein n=1 Tax=Trichinella papuae TaxID=268474 RepID=A0A0V1LWX9_9BILA|nr:hypothetical protein T10_5312 [Trichinella papuae]